MQMVRKTYQDIAEGVRGKLQANPRQYPLIRNPDTLKGGCQNAALMTYQQLTHLGKFPRIFEVSMEIGFHLVVVSGSRIIDPTITQYIKDAEKYIYSRNNYPLNPLILGTEDVTNSPMWGLNPV